MATYDGTPDDDVLLGGVEDDILLGGLGNIRERRGIDTGLVCTLPWGHRNRPDRPSRRRISRYESDHWPRIHDRAQESVPRLQLQRLNADV